MKFKDFEVSQASNGHLWVYRNGEFVVHINSSGPKTEEEVSEIMSGFMEIYARIDDYSLEAMK